MAPREKTREKSRTPTENRARQKPKEESQEPKPNNDGKETKTEEVEEMEVDPEAKKRLEFQSPECKEPLSTGEAPEQMPRNHEQQLLSKHSQTVMKNLSNPRQEAPKANSQAAKQQKQHRLPKPHATWN